MNRFAFLFLLVSTCSLALSSTTLATTEGSASPLETVIVVGERTERPVRESTWATGVLLRESLLRFPARNLPDALSFLPGTTFLERDGSGHMPMAITRGFYGGGETEYILLSVDGVPINDVRTGLVEWSQIPMSEIERVEILRGGASALYGDAALGSVVNVVTRARSVATPEISTSLLVGDLGLRSLESGFSAPVGEGLLRLSGSGRHSEGFRKNSDWEDVRFGGVYQRETSSPVALQARWNLQRVDSKDPGPLSPEQIADDREQSNPFYEDDHRRRDRFDAGVRLESTSLESRRLTLDLGASVTDQDETRTLLVSPTFGNTQFHDQLFQSYWTRLQFEQHVDRHRIVAGIDAEVGRYDSEYFSPDDLSTSLSEGDGDRLEGGGYVEAHGMFFDRVHASAGVRVDVIRDDHTNDTGADLERDFDEWSPRFGVNVAYSQNATARGNFYANWTRAFKAPTLDQLYDRRVIPAGPGTTINIANSDLLPQKSDGFEVGVYQSFEPTGSEFEAALSVSAYRIDLEDEIDFDPATFRYGNIQESRHDGIEAGVAVEWGGRTRVTSALNLMDVTFRSGDNEGNQLKAIPEVTVTSGVHVSVLEELGVGLTYRYVGEVFLDDENMRTLPEYGTFDVRFDSTWRRARFHVSILNVANTRNNSTGFLLFNPSTFGQDELLYPAQGRSIRFGIDL